MAEDKRFIGYVSRNGEASLNIATKAAGKNFSQQLAGGDDADEFPFADKTGELRGLAAPPYDPESLVHLLEMSTWHFRACQTKATDAAGSGYDIKPVYGVDSPRKSQRKKVEEFFSDLSEPINEVLRKAFFDYEGVGYGAIEILRENNSPTGKIVDLKHIPAHTLRVHKSKKKYCQIRGKNKKWFKDISHVETEVSANTGEEREGLSGPARANEVIFMRQYHPKSDHYGVPQIIPALGAMLGDVEREEFNISFFKNYGVPAYAIFITGDYDPGAIDENGRSLLQKTVEKHMDEIGSNPRSTLLLTIPSGTNQQTGAPGKVEVHFEKLAADNEEASFEQYRQSNRDEVLGTHGVPIHRIGLSEAGAMGENVARESNEIYKRARIDPLQDMVEFLLNRYVVREELEVEDYEWKLPDLDTRDEEHDIEVATPLFAMGGITPNQLIRHFGRKFGLEPSDDPAMDYHYIGGAAVELGLAKDPASTQGQRPVDEETEGMSARGTRQATTGNKNEKTREDLEDAGGNAAKTKKNVPSERK